MLIRINLSLFVILCLTSSVFAQFDPNPELDWYTIETTHFYVHYYKGTVRTANTAAIIAEEIYGPITSLYNYEPKDKVSLIFNDESDFSNGATDYYGNRIEIAAGALDFELRGTHNWLRNVITHEFTHIVQVQSSMKLSRKVPSIYLQWLNYEGERRPDVLYGYPDIIVSYPFSGIIVPSWYAEGTAQYQRQQMGYDFWDSHRDMILRTITLDDKLLSWNDMGQFASVTTLKAESIYNMGFALVRYISWKYGEDKLKEISHNLSNLSSLNCESAFKNAIGKSGSDLYDEWKDYLKRDYNERIKNVKKNETEGAVIASTGFANYSPQFSQDGKNITYLSNKTFDYGSTSLFSHKMGEKNDDNDKLLIAGVSGGYSWSPDGSYIIFARRNKPTIHEKSVFDLYVYNKKSKEEEQITHNKRAHSPAYSFDGKEICFVVNGDGTQNLCFSKNTLDKQLTEVVQLTNNKNGEQIYSPKWSPDGNYIIYDYSDRDSRGIAMIEVSSGKLEHLFESTDADFRNPVFSPDNKYIYISSDMTGIYNIYRYETVNEMSMTAADRKAKLHQITNVKGGAFMPAVDSAGKLTFSSYKSSGYTISVLDSISEIDSLVESNNAVYSKPERVFEKYAQENENNSMEAKDHFDWLKLKNFNDTVSATKPRYPYNNASTSLFFIPVLRFDNYTKNGTFWDALKPGLYFYSQDVLGKMGIFGGASMNKNLERDLFLEFDYNNGVPFLKNFFINKLSFVPYFTLQGFNITRKTNAEIIAGIDSANVNLTYDLLEFDFAMAFKIINSNHNLKFGFSISSYTSDLDAFSLPSVGSIPGSSTNYFKGRDLSLTYTYSSIKPSKNDDINPVGRNVKIKYDYEFNYLNPTLSVDNQGNVIEVYNKAKFHRLEANWSESFSLFNTHSLGFKLNGGSIIGPTQDNFFDFYASGLPGMKGYPFYAIGGNRYATANLTYRFPIAQGLDFNFLQFYFDKVYFSLFGDMGNAWDGNATKLKDFKKDIGAELRLQTYSYYVYPTSFALSAAYGLDQFSNIFPSTTNTNQLVTYGKEWRFYLTVLFGFDFITDLMKKF